MADVRATLPDSVVDLRDEEVEAVAQQECGSLAGGKDTAAVVSRTEQLAGVGKAEARQLTKLAIDDVCPDQRGRAGDF